MFPTDLLVVHANADRERLQRVLSGLAAFSTRSQEDDEERPPNIASLHRLIESAQFVLVVWSWTSIRSEFLLMTASIADARGKLVQLRLDGSTNAPYEAYRGFAVDVPDGDIVQPGFLQLHEELWRRLQAHRMSHGDSPSRPSPTSVTGTSPGDTPPRPSSVPSHVPYPTESEIRSQVSSSWAASGDGPRPSSRLSQPVSGDGPRPSSNVFAGAPEAASQSGPDSPFRIFISWSGPRGQRAASALSDAIRHLLPYAAPWTSSEDLASGRRWNAEIDRALRECQFGVIVVTPESENAAWLAFEAGALSVGISKDAVCPWLVDSATLSGPLAGFHARRAERAPTRLLLRDINKAAGGPIDQRDLDDRFRKVWPWLSGELADTGREPSQDEGHS